MNCAQANTSSMLGIIEKTRVRITGNRAMRPKKGEGFNHSRHFSGVVGVDSGTCECQMSFSRDSWPKHDVYSSMERSCDRTPSCKCFTISKASTPVSVDGPSLEIIAFVACRGTDVGKMRISGFGSQQTKVLTWTTGICLVRQINQYAWAKAGVGREARDANFIRGRICAMQKRLTGPRILKTRKDISLAKSRFCNPSRSKAVAAFCFLSCGDSLSLP